MTKLETETAAAIYALRQLLIAVCRVRPDGADLLRSFESGWIQIVLDEPSGMLEIGRSAGVGQRVKWIEIIACDPTNDASFGLVGSSVVLPKEVTPHVITRRRWFVEPPA